MTQETALKWATLVMPVVITLAGGGLWHESKMDAAAKTAHGEREIVAKSRQDALNHVIVSLAKSCRK